MLRARDVMTHEVRTAQADWTLDELATFLTEHSISGAPVIDGGEKAIGVVSTTDLVRCRMPDQLAFPDATELLERAADAGMAPDELRGFGVQVDSGMRVRDIMTPLVYDVSEDTPVHEIADAMLRGRIHRVVVTRKGFAVGIVSSLDLLRIVRDLGQKAE